MDLVLFGPPGAGKGTQAKRLVEELHVPQISTGDIMRAERASGSDLGKRFDEYMSQGKLVPDDLVVELLEQRLRTDDAKNGAIFDGYPRTVAQAHALDGLLGRMDRKVDRVVSLEVPVAVVAERITGRRVCEGCGQTYHMRYTPPPQSGVCPSCGGRVVQRKDDTEEVVRTRFDAYEAETQPVLEHYRGRGVVVSVNGVGSLDEVRDRIEAAIGSKS